MKPITPLILLLLAACSGPAPAPQAAPMAAPMAADAPTNRIEVPPEVITSLGITFVKPERRPVRRTLRVPGYFESPPEAQVVWTAPLAGRLRLQAAQYQQLEAGAALFTLESPAWREMQSQLAGAQSDASRAEAVQRQAQLEAEGIQRNLEPRAARVAAQAELVARQDERITGLERTRDHWAARVKQLEDLEAAAGGRAAELAEARAAQLNALDAILAARADRTDAQVQLEDARVELAAERLRAQTALAAAAVAGTELEAARQRHSLLARTAAALIGMPAEAPADGEWQKLDGPTLKVPVPARVLALHVSNGAWVEAGTPVLTTLGTDLRFRARGLQADLGLLRDGLEARIVPPAGGSLSRAVAINGRLQLLPEADAASRTMDLLVIPESAASWARPGVTAEVEIIHDDAKQRPELALPLACVVRDGLNSVIFVRDPLSPDKVIRTPVELGRNDGRWVELFGGVGNESEVVLDGAYELNLTAKPAAKGHFHADGSFHGEDH